MPNDEAVNNIISGVVGIFQGTFPSAIYGNLQQTVPLSIGNVNMGRGATINIRINDKPLVSDDMNPEDTALARATAYASSKPSRVKAYNRRTKSGTVRVEAHKRSSTKPSLERQIQLAEAGESPPMRPINFDVDTIIENAVDKGVQQLVAHLKTQI